MILFLARLRNVFLNEMFKFCGEVIGFNAFVNISTNL